MQEWEVLIGVMYSKYQCILCNNAMYARYFQFSHMMKASNCCATALRWRLLVSRRRPNERTLLQQTQLCARHETGHTVIFGQVLVTIGGS